MDNVDTQFFSQCVRAKRKRQTKPPAFEFLYSLSSSTFIYMLQNYKHKIYFTHTRTLSTQSSPGFIYCKEDIGNVIAVPQNAKVKRWFEE